MKRFFVILAVFMLIAGVSLAETKVNSTENRHITPNVPADPSGEAAAALYKDLTVSPTTGLTLSDYDLPSSFAGLAKEHVYFPVLVQISCPYDESTKASGTGNRAPWGVQYADIIYELPLHQNGEVRMSALFSDVLPTDVGPIRSARIGHAWLREEWDCGFMYYGQQEYKNTNVIEEFRRTGASSKGLLWPGTVGESRPWKKYYEAYTSRYLHNSPLKSPNNRTGNPAGFFLDYLLPQWPDIVAIPSQVYHFYSFADKPYTGGDKASIINVSWNRKDSNEMFKYNETTGQYERHIESESKKEASKNVLWVELESQQPITFSNVIVQWTETIYLGRDAPVTQNVGAYNSKTKNYDAIGGNAEIFMSGRHISGYWYRNGLHARTVFYDENGQEIALQRGKSMIIQLPYENACTYEAIGEDTPAAEEDDSSYTDLNPDTAAYDSVWVAEGGQWRIDSYSEDDGFRQLVTHKLGDGMEDIWEYSSALNTTGDALVTVPFGLHYQQDEDGNGRTTYYEDGDAVFTLTEDGRLMWDDLKEHAGEGLKFEKIGLYLYGRWMKGNLEVHFYDWTDGQYDIRLNQRDEDGEILQTSMLRGVYDASTNTITATGEYNVVFSRDAASGNVVWTENGESTVMEYSFMTD